MTQVKLFLIFIFITVLSTLLISCGKKEQPQEIIRPVRYIDVYSTGGNRVRTFAGIARAGVESNLSFKVPGTVQRIAVKVGDQVKAGQLIAQLDPVDYRLEVQRAEAALEQAKAQARNADAAYERAMQLYENRNISRSDLDAARAAAESAGAAVSSMEKQLELARRQLSYARLNAPLSGAIASVDAEINENIRAGQTIVTLTSGSQIEVEITLPEVLISGVTEGQKGEVTFDALPEKKFEGIITEVGVAATEMASAYPVTVRLNSAAPEIRPGMAASVSLSFNSGNTSDRYFVPTQAVMEDRQGRYVFIVEPVENETGFGIVHRQPVEVGDVTMDGIEILEGLTDGERVVTAGVSRISDGQKVRM